MINDNSGATKVAANIDNGVNNNATNAQEAVQTTQKPITETVQIQESPQEKLLKQSEVNEIVGAVRKEAAERARKEALAELQKSQNVNTDQDNKHLGMSEERARQIFLEEQERAANTAIANKVAMEFTQKMYAGKDKYQDFEQVVSQLNLPNVPEIVHWTNSLDNTADVVYDIAKNPSKFANILMLQHTAPHLAQIELQKLSSSIKKNQEAQAQPQTKEPLSQITPSTAGIDSGKMTIQDFKNADWLRG